MHEPMRTCSVCRRKANKSEFIRIVRVGDQVLVDESGKGQGRGAYICNNAECINKCVTKRLLNRSFKTQIGDEVYDAIAKLGAKD